MDAPAAQVDILGTRISLGSRASAVRRVIEWARAGQARYACFCNVHSVVTAYWDPTLRSVLNGADSAFPDGMPIAWAARLLGFRGQERVDGPTLMLDICREAAREDVPIFLYGGAPHTLEALRNQLTQRLPGLRIAGALSPPFRPLSAEEDQAFVDRIRNSGARIIFVGLGAPKQEHWMASHRDRIGAVLLGVGAAFDFHAGRLARAPAWMQRSGLEWLFRLASEPRRLWRRYLLTNPQFVILLAFQLLRHKMAGAGSQREVSS